MNKSTPFIYSAALMPDGRLLTKVNMRDEARALDKYMIIDKEDELYDEALINAVSYVVLLDDGSIEVKARFVETDSPGGLDSSTRKKVQFASDSLLHKRLTMAAGPFIMGKPVWLDLPKEAKK